MIRRLIRRGEPAVPSTDQGSESESGATLVLAAAALIVLIGMAGFAVDLGWLFLKTTETKKAAESAALAGVIHMPTPGAIPWGPGAEGYDVAIDVAGRNGYTAGVTPLEVAARPNQLQVEINNTVPTFFIRIFGINQVSYMRDAVAEHLPPLKLGSDESYLGSDPDGFPATNRFFWVAINGEERRKQDGDPFSTRCINSGCPGLEHLEFKDPAYFYGIQVPASGLGQLVVELYDAPHNSGGLNLPGDFGGGNDVIEFVLHEPGPTLGSLGPPICTQQFNAGPAAAVDAWFAMPCTPPSVAGIYVLSVAILGDDTAISSFSIRASVGGTNNVAVFGLGAMSLWMQDAGVAPNFKVVKLEEIYAGSQLIISLYDPGDVSFPGGGGSAILRFLGEAAPYDCEIRIRDDDGIGASPATGWIGDDSPGSPPCEFQTAPKIYNANWVDVRFDVPDAYVCLVGCWVTVDYALSAGANVSERTTWTARINGLPTHLLP